MKTTIDISDDLFERVQQLARKEETSFRALTEAGLRLVLADRRHKHARRLPPLVTFGKDGPKGAFKDLELGADQREGARHLIAVDTNSAGVLAPLRQPSSPASRGVDRWIAQGACSLGDSVAVHS